MRQMDRNSGMRGGAGGRLDGGLRSADLRLQVESEVVDLCFGFDTPALAYGKGGGSLRAFRLAGL